MSSFEVDEQGIADLLNEQWARDKIDEADRAIIAEAAQLAPIGRDPRFGHVRNDFAVEAAHTTPDGVEGAAGSHNPLYHLIEYGSVNNPPYRPLTRAVRNLGLDFEEHTK